MTKVTGFETYLDNKDFQEERKELHDKRRKVAEEKLLPLIESFTNGEIPLSKFRSNVDGINKKNDHWGFNGFAGMMFFNKISKFPEMENRIRKDIQTPENLKQAKNTINKFAKAVAQLDSTQQEGVTQAPAPKSTVFFLSYFWNLQEPEKFPMFHKSARETLENQTSYSDNKDNYGEMYQEFVKQLGQVANEYNIENDWKFEKVNGILYRINEEEEEKEQEEVEEAVEEKDEGYQNYIPPVAQDFHKIAEGSKEIQKKYDVDLAKLMEKKAEEIFRLIGFETKQLGQGTGREPDGLAYTLKDGYGIIWDTKKRENNGYKLSASDERKVREYIESYRRSFQERGIDTIYFLTISSGFKNINYDNGLESSPSVGNINFIEAGDLAELLGLVIKHPEIKLSDIENLFKESSKIEREQLPQAKPETKDIF